MFKIALYEPQIPQNTGNIARLAAGIGCELILLGKLGFSLEDRYLKRAGLDYWEHVKLTHISDVCMFFNIFQNSYLAFVTKFGQYRYDKIFDKSGCGKKDVVMVFGNETVGLPQDIHEKYNEQRFFIPMNSNVRSLNLSNSVAIVVYEYLRQTGFVIGV